MVDDNHVEDVPFPWRIFSKEDIEKDFSKLKEKITKTEIEDINLPYSYFGTTHVLDPYAGWGNRCLGAMASGIDYTGIDSNPGLQKPFQEMMSYFYTNSKITFYSGKSEQVLKSFDMKDIDLIFTSPPYWKNGKLMEKYDECEKDEDLFLKNSLFPLMRIASTHKIKVCLYLNHSLYSKIVGSPKEPTIKLKMYVSSLKPSLDSTFRKTIFCW